jgi:hypothetical protein
MTLDARRKGVRRERDVVNRYRAAGYTANRDPARLESDGRSVGVDVRAWGPVHLAIQVRAQARPNVWTALEDAQRGALPGEIPIAHVRKTDPTATWPDNKADDLVCLTENDFFALLARLPVEDR